MGHRRSQGRFVFQDAQIDSCTLCRLDVGNRPELPSASVRVFPGTINDEKVGEHHLGSGLCSNIAFIMRSKVYLRMLNPEILHIVRILGCGKVK
jgi:hypothetical protein